MLKILLPADLLGLIIKTRLSSFFYSVHPRRTKYEVEYGRMLLADPDIPCYRIRHLRVHTCEEFLQPYHTNVQHQSVRHCGLSSILRVIGSPLSDPILVPKIWKAQGCRS